MKIYQVFWSFNHRDTKENSSVVNVYAYDKKDAMSKASRTINNPLAWIIAAEEK